MTVVHRPRFLSDNGSFYVASDLADWLDERNIEHVRRATSPAHPQAKGKIEQLASDAQDRIVAEHRHYLPGDLRTHRSRPSPVRALRLHARYVTRSLGNLALRLRGHQPGRAETVLLERERIKRQTIANRRLQHQLRAA